MSPGLLMLFGFAGAVATVLGIYSIIADLYLRDRQRVSQRVDEEFRMRLRAKAQKSTLFKDLSLLNLEATEEVAKDNTWQQRLNALLEQSGTELTPQKLFAYMAATGLLAAACGTLLGKSLIVGGLVGLAGAYIPFAIVQIRRGRRLQRIMAQLPDAFELMARCVRAGQTVSQSMQAVADEFEAPLAPEFSYCYEQMNLGLPAELAMRDLARRIGLMEIKVFVLAMLIQTQTGGNLAELLDKLGNIVRERFKIQGKIKALTGEGRLQAWVLLALPFALLGVVMMLNRSYVDVFFARPGILMTMLTFELLGALWIHKIINFDY